VKRTEESVGEADRGKRWRRVAAAAPPGRSVRSSSSPSSCSPSSRPLHALAFLDVCRVVTTALVFGTPVLVDGAFLLGLALGLARGEAETQSLAHALVTVRLGGRSAAAMGSYDSRPCRRTARLAFTCWYVSQMTDST
jgi:hypothetical protein